MKALVLSALLVSGCASYVDAQPDTTRAHFTAPIVEGPANYLAESARTGEELRDCTDWHFTFPPEFRAYAIRCADGRTFDVGYYFFDHGQLVVIDTHE